MHHTAIMVQWELTDEGKRDLSVRKSRNKLENKKNNRIKSKTSQPENLSL